jgi:short subunit dehydrogenase-like uncharacterized protein
VGGWVGPFIMASINTRVVRRSNALRDWAYGRQFRYQEVTGFGPGPAGSAGQQYVTQVAGRGDPGYQATAVMFGESALCLALDRDRLPAVAGVLTPATAMGPVLAGRLRSAGLTLTADRAAGH